MKILIMIKIYLRFTLVLIFCMPLNGCVERGKPIKKEVNEQSAKKDAKEGTKKIEHYICQNGHKGSHKQGVCPECNIAYTHNQAYHGLNIPKDALKDPFKQGTPTTTSASPAQNAYGDYHYICPNGHSGGSGTAGNCSSCNAKLTHNQLYHK